MSGKLRAVSRLVAADLVYRPIAELSAWVADSRGGWVTVDIYHGTTRIQRTRIPREAFLLLFSNYSNQGESR